MDPDANLSEQLTLANELLKFADDPSRPAFDDPEFLTNAVVATRLAELVIALNEWIEKGGFLPEQWRKI